MSDDYFDRGPKATVHFCDPATMDHPLHRLMGVRHMGWWVLTRHGCVVEVYGPFETRHAADVRTKAWMLVHSPRRASSL